MTANALLVPSLGSEVLGRYRGVSWLTRLFLNLRWCWTPYEEIASKLPREGTILDLGSGHGLLALVMALQCSGRQVRGTDHDAGRFALARRAAHGLENLDFQAGNLLERVRDEKIDLAPAGIVIMDTLHYLSPEEQNRLVRWAYSVLVPGGIFLVRDVDAGAGLSYLWNNLHERVMTGLGFTRAERMHFRARTEWEELFQGPGFAVTSEKCSRFPFADLLFTCTKPRPAA